MKREEFEGLIKRLENFAQTKPGQYTARVALLAALGYAYLLGVLLLLLSATVALVWMVIAFPNAATIKICIIGGVVTVGLSSVILRAFWVRLPPPEGLELTSKEAPALFEMLRALSVELGAPQFDHVLLTGDFNAAVVQVPRFGVFGWQKNYLILGLPLMQALSPEQFRSVLAHEIAHLSRNHSRFASWIYRVRRTWDNVFEQMSRQGQSGWALFLKFIRWYAPYFDAYSFVLARSNEYEADRWSARLAGAQTAAHALILTQVQGRFVGDAFWPDVYKQAIVQPAPPASAFLNLAESLRKGPAREDARKWLTQALCVRTNNSDTHPCLRDRLAAIGYLRENQAVASITELPPLPEVTAVEQFLGGTGERYCSELEKRWRTAIEKNWRERYEQAQKLQQKLKTLEEKMASQLLTPAERWECAQLVGDLQGDEAMEPLLREIIAAEPDHAAANFVLGRIYLERDDEAGVALVERAMAKDPEAVQAGCNLLYGFYERTGRHEKERPLVERFDEHSDKLALAQQERAQVTAKDNFLPHQLTDEQVADLRRQLQTYVAVEAAHMARKDVRHFPEKPLYVLAIKPVVKWYRWRSSSADTDLVQRLVNELKLPGHTLIFVENQNLVVLGKKVRNVPNALIYRKEMR